MQTYTVRSGDTLGKIAKKFYSDAARFPLIVAANHIGNPDRLAIGAQLVIPDVGAPTIPTAPPLPAPTSTPSPNGRTTQLNEQRFAQLCPSVATRGRAMVDLCAHAGLAVLVTQGLRTWQEQDQLYAKGRTVPPIGKAFVVTNAKGGQSYHNFGLGVRPRIELLRSTAAVEGRTVKTAKHGSRFCRPRSAAHRSV
jgi:hypothetical protein